MNTTKCPNCETPSTTGEYCAVCGQRNRHARLQARELAGDLFEQFIELRMQWPRTVIELCTRPGLVALDYVHGKRARFVNPAKYFFVIVAAAYLIPVLFDDGGPSNGTAVSVVLLVLVLMQIAVLRLLFWRADRNATEIAVFSLYLTAQSQLLQMLLLGGLITLIERRDTIADIASGSVIEVIAPAALGIVYTYVVVGVGQFFATSLWRAVLASILAFGVAYFAILWLDFSLGLGTMR